MESRINSKACIYLFLEEHTERINEKTMELLLTRYDSEEETGEGVRLS